MRAIWPLVIKFGNHWVIYLRPPFVLARCQEFCDPPDSGYDKADRSVVGTSGNVRPSNRIHAQYIRLFDAYGLAGGHGCTIPKALA